MKKKENIKIDENGCWIWQKSCITSGYGQIKIKGKIRTTHTYVFECSGGILKKGYHVRHSCHNRKCCNPEHLSLGTPKDNYEDSIAKHTDSRKKLSKKWIICGKEYTSSRQAIKYTGICSATLQKYTINNIFNVKLYLKGCKKTGSYKKGLEKIRKIYGRQNKCSEGSYTPFPPD